MSRVRSPHRVQRVAVASLLSGLACLALGGCAGPQPWEKGQLAKPEMAMGGNPLEMRYTAHIATSKEAASGGNDIGGGGCGCN